MRIVSRSWQANSAAGVSLQADGRRSLGDKTVLSWGGRGGLRSASGCLDHQARSSCGQRSCACLSVVARTHQGQAVVQAGAEARAGRQRREAACRAVVLRRAAAAEGSLGLVPVDPSRRVGPRAARAACLRSEVRLVAGPRAPGALLPQARSSCRMLPGPAANRKASFRPSWDRSCSRPNCPSKRLATWA